MKLTFCIFLILCLLIMVSMVTSQGAKKKKVKKSKQRTHTAKEEIKNMQNTPICFNNTLADFTDKRLPSFSALPMQCQVSALTQNRVPYSRKALREMRGFLFEPEPRPLVKLTPHQMLWFLTQGVQEKRLTTFQSSEVGVGRKKRYLDADLSPEPLIMQDTEDLRVRKEIRMMTDREWETFVEAVLAMKSTFPGTGLDDFSDSTPKSEYDIMVIFHNGANAPSAHNGAAFLPWHREYLLRFEQALRRHRPDVTLPYWDSSLDESLPDTSHSVIWTEHFLGDNNGVVTTGPFKDFSAEALDDIFCLFGGTFNLTRYTRNDGSMLFDHAKLEEHFEKITYSELMGPLESDHDAVHIYVNGHMSRIACAPTDPVFYMHHAFIDLIWEEFRRYHQESDPETDYPSDATSGHGASDPMSPFEPLVNICGLSNHYTNCIYKYAERPSKGFCTSDGGCKSKYLWCDLNRCRCTSKVKVGGNCTGLPDRACYCEGRGRQSTPLCNNGLCECTEDRLNRG